MTEVVRTQTPPILNGPSEKERKYDRQLRLWAASGQSALENAQILLVNSGAGTVGVETLKNLVLPGIGRFVIFDEAIVDETDLGVNFFVNESYRGKSRAQAATELLMELNPDVKGEWNPRPQGPATLSQLLDSSVMFTIIVLTAPVRREDLELLENYCHERKTPLVTIHSAGFYSYFRVSLPGAFPIVDTHPDETATTDLRLLSPWPELADFARRMTTNIDDLDSHEHGHLPYVVILLHYLKKWREEHGGSYPSTYKDKIEFRKLIQDATRTGSPEGGEENFEEAAAAVLKTVTSPTLPSGLEEVFGYQHADPIEQASSFWIIADAVHEFYNRHNYLPVRGGLPDMKAQPKDYIQLQNIYKTKARQDAIEVFDIVRRKPNGGEIELSEVELFCKNAAFVKLVNQEGGARRTDADLVSRLKTVYADEVANDQMAELTMAPLSLVPILLALYVTLHGLPEKADDIIAAISKFVPDADKNERVFKAAKEVARAEGGEMHNISALTGGMAAQEIIKIITKQYIPIDNTCVFDGINSRCQVFRL